MARRIRVQSLIAALLFASALQAGVIANYTFDDDDLATGPDTFAVFENAKGRVDLAADVRYSGYHSLRIEDVADDGDFPELQGYFPAIADGVLHFRFAMLVANPHEPLNIALAGPSHFAMTKDGIAFWLRTRNGVLQHLSDGIPKKLFALEPFAWYIVNVRLALARGTYDLTITREGRAEALVALRDQPNATSSPRSAVSMFSFVGSVFEDDSNVRYYIDDVALATDSGADAKPFAAPGRRKLFVDRWRETMKADAKRKGCPPIFDFDDVGASARDIDEARERISWLRNACANLDNDAVLRELNARAAASPRAASYTYASIVALTRRNRWEEAEAKWAAAGPALRNDVRYGWMAALLGMHRENWDDAESWLRAPAHELAAMQNDRQRKLIAEEYFFVLLWRKENAEAAAYADGVAHRLAKLGIDASWWRERAGDAQLLTGRTTLARAQYELARNKHNEWSITEKLADVAHLERDVEGERKLREKLYGSLR